MATAVRLTHDKGVARVRHVRDASGVSLVPFVSDIVAAGAVILTDGWTGYNDLPTTTDMIGTASALGIKEELTDYPP